MNRSGFISLSPPRKRGPITLDFRLRAVCSSAGRALGPTAPRGRRGGNDRGTYETTSRLVRMIKVLFYVSVFQILVSGCAVDATQVNLAQILAWNEGDSTQWENSKYNSSKLSDTPAQSLNDISPFFRVTNARMLLGSVYENEGVDADYV